MKIKVAQLTCVYPPYGGGIGRVAYDYASWLKDDYQVTVFTPRYHKGQTFLNNPGVSLQTFRPAISFGKAALWPGLKGWLKYFDIVHLHYPWFGVQEWLPYLPKSIKLLISYHMKPLAPGLKGWLFNLDRRLFENELLKRADILLCSTQDYLNGVIKPSSEFINKWHVLPFAPDNQFKPQAADLNLKNSLGIKSHESVILFVGTLDKAHYFKGLNILLMAAAQLRQPFKILLVGGGDKKIYKNLAEDLGIIDRLVFAGYVPDKKLPAYYNLADVLVFPSLNQSESFGLVALQAMASAKPVIASKLAGVQELIKDGENGLLVSPGNVNSLALALDGLLDAPD
ncbi:MAG: glycosyltransferase family 4 protein, partial [Patescibacteria group bacterium]